jgi:hypothetical protein
LLFDHGIQPWHVERYRAYEWTALVNEHTRRVREEAANRAIPE